jgi:hypothetical protein
MNDYQHLFDIDALTRFASEVNQPKLERSEPDLVCKQCNFIALIYKGSDNRVAKEVFKKDQSYYWRLKHEQTAKNGAPLHRPDWFVQKVEEEFWKALSVITDDMAVMLEGHTERVPAHIANSFQKTIDNVSRIHNVLKMKRRATTGPSKF